MTDLHKVACDDILNKLQNAEMFARNKHYSAVAKNAELAATAAMYYYKQFLDKED